MKTKNLSLAIGALVCSAMVGLLAIQNNTYALDSSDPDANHDAAIQIVDEYDSILQTYFQTNYPDLTVSFNKGADYWQPYYKPDFANAYIRLMWGYSVETQYDYTSTTDLPEDSSDDMISSFLTNKGFQLYVEETGGYPANTEYLNSDTGVICAYIKGQSLSGLSCSHINELQVSTDWQSFLNAIGTAYYAKENKLAFIGYASEAYSSEPDIKDSDYDPYQYVLVPMGNFVGMFYRQSPTSNWVYFAGTQAPLDCSEYTGEAEKGFAGYICYNGDEASTVGASTDEEDSSLSAPDTGVYTGDNEGLIASLSMITATTSVIVYFAHYAIKRQQSKVHFDK